MAQEGKKKIRSNLEAPFTGKYWDNEEAGTYLCSKCATPLFSSSEKFDAGEGWPTFHKPLDESALQFKPDDEVENRVEVRCKKCKRELGFFLTGDKQHYRIDSLALRFIPEKAPEAPAQVAIAAPSSPAGLLPATLGPTPTLLAGVVAGLVLGASGTFLYCKSACVASVGAPIVSTSTAIAPLPFSQDESAAADPNKASTSTDDSLEF